MKRPRPTLALTLMRSQTALPALLAAVLWGAAAQASATFPSVVDAHLGLMVPVEKIAPPDGCLLCHRTESGGLGTNNAFGLLMKENGAVGAEPATVGPALDKLAQTDPRAIMDLVDGINPNDDPTALSNDPVPEYGCAMTARNGPPGWPPAALVLGLGIPVLRRVRRSGARLSRGV